MVNARKLGFVIAGSSLLSAASYGQIPDLLNALDAGGRSMGMGGSVGVTGSDSLSSFYNPAGLAYLEGETVGISYRNLPESRSRLGNTKDNPRFNTSIRKGSSEITHLGYTVPVAKLFKKGAGVIGISYTLGGYINEIGTAASIGVEGGAFTISNYRRAVESRTGFYSVAYGRTNAAQNLAYGLGIAFAEQKSSFKESGTAADWTPAYQQATANGVGLIAGIQYVNPSAPNVNYGLSYRSEIKLNHTIPLYDRIPARLMGGVSARVDGFRGGKDYVVAAAQVTHFFAGQSSIAFDRDAQTVFGSGLEYNYNPGTYTVPVRLGFELIPSGGSTYGRRNAFTYGIGYKPAGGEYGIDLNWASYTNGGRDFALSATYRFK